MDKPETNALRRAADGAYGYLSWLERHGDEDAGKYARKLEAGLEADDARVKQLEEALSGLIYSMNFRSRVDRGNAQRAAREILEGVKNG